MRNTLLAVLAAAALAPAQPATPTDLHQLTHGGQNAEAYWSPDGKRLIFQSTRPPYGCDQIFIMNAAGIASHSALNQTWIFKGGTCLRKCYYETFRFSEDLDFTVMEGGPDKPDDLQRIFGEIAEWLLMESGIELTLDDHSFQRRRNRRGKPTTQGRIAYQGPNPQPTSPKVKLDITTDEVLVERPELRPIGHPYTHRNLPSSHVPDSLVTWSGKDT